MIWFLSQLHILLGSLLHMHDKKILIPGNPPEDNPWVEHIHQPIDKPDARQYNIASNNSKLSMPEKTTGIIQAQRKLSSLRCFCNDLNLIKTDEQKATQKPFGRLLWNPMKSWVVNRDPYTSLNSCITVNEVSNFHPLVGSFDTQGELLTPQFSRHDIWTCPQVTLPEAISWWAPKGRRLIFQPSVSGAMFVSSQKSQVNPTNPKETPLDVPVCLPPLLINWGTSTNIKLV